MVVIEKNIKLKEKRVELTANSDDANMFTLKMDDLDPNATKIVQAYHAKMLKILTWIASGRQKNVIDFEDMHGKYAKA